MGRRPEGHSDLVLKSQRQRVLHGREGQGRRGPGPARGSGQERLRGQTPTSPPWTADVRPKPPAVGLSSHRASSRPRKPLSRAGQAVAPRRETGRSRKALSQPFHPLASTESRLCVFLFQRLSGTHPAGALRPHSCQPPCGSASRSFPHARPPRARAASRVQEAQTTLRRQARRLLDRETPI